MYTGANRYWNRDSNALPGKEGKRIGTRGMFRKVVFYDGTSGEIAAPSRFPFVVPGVTLVLFGILILLLPQLLLLLVAAFFICCGIGLIGLGLNIRRLSNNARSRTIF